MFRIIRCLLLVAIGGIDDIKSEGKKEVIQPQLHAIIISKGIVRIIRI